MRRALICASFVFAITSPLLADANLQITDVGLHGYTSSRSAVRVLLRNPAAQPQSIHLQISSWLARRDSEAFVTDTLNTEVPLAANEQRALELPVAVREAEVTRITADAFVAGSAISHDTFRQPLHDSNLVVFLCADDRLSQAIQSQIQFSGSVEDRADKNRQIAFEIVRDPRDHWWAYTPAKAIVLALPTATLAPAQRQALEGFVRAGGLLVLLEDDIADPTFLAAYRQNSTPAQSPVGTGTLFRVGSLQSNQLGALFARPNLELFLSHNSVSWDSDWLSTRYAAAFDFPRLASVLFWLVLYTILVGLVNFAILRRARRLEFGWFSVCALALLFAVGFYWVNASRRPKTLRLDNLASYRLDAHSPLALAEYSLRVSAPERRDLTLSIVDSAVFTGFAAAGSNVANAQIWAEINPRHASYQDRASRRSDDVHLGLRDQPEASQVDLSLLKWSFEDLSLHGLRQFPGTVHFVAPNRLRNDTGQQFTEAVYVNNFSLYTLPPLAPGQEVQLDSITPRTVHTYGELPPWANPGGSNDFRQSLQELVLWGKLPSLARGKVFAGFTDGPALPVELNLPHDRNTHSFIVVDLGRP